MPTDGPARPHPPLRRYAVRVRLTRWTTVGITAESPERAAHWAESMTRWQTGNEAIADVEDVREVEAFDAA